MRREPAPLGPGRESEVLALVAPHALGREVAAGLRLMNVRIEPSVIELTLRGPAGQVQLRLRPAIPGAKTTESFEIERGAGANAGPGKVATDALIAAIRANDRGGFWRRSSSPTARPTPDDPARGIQWPLGVTLGFGALAWLLAWRERRRRRA